MADGPRSDAERAADAARLRDLEARLTSKTPAQAGPRPMASHDQAHVAWRMVIELVAGLGLGVGIGFGLDHLFGTRPLMLVVFALLGFAAGIKTMLRTAAELNRPGDTGTDLPAHLADDDEERD